MIDVQTLPTYSEVRAVQCRKSFYEFWKEFVPTLIPNLHEPPFIKYLCDIIQPHVDRAINNQKKEVDVIVINVPPGTTKSTTISQVLPVYGWAKAPWARFMCVSYGQPLANELAEKARDLIRSDKYQLYYRLKLKDDARKITNFKTEEGGQRLSTSTTGTGTGIHAHIRIYDDPHKVPDPDKDLLGATPAELLNDVKKLKSRFSSRNVDEDVTLEIVVMQRVSDQDYSAEVLRLAESEGLRVLHICLPANIKSLTKEMPDGSTRSIPGYPCSPAGAERLYSEDGLLDPIRKGPNALFKALSMLGNVGYAQQYGQDSTPPEGGIMRRDAWGYYHPDDLPSDGIINAYVDGAFTSDKKNDPTGILVYKVHEGFWYFIGFAKVWLETPDLGPYMAKFCLSLGYSSYSGRIRIEGKGPGKAWCQAIRRVGGIIERIPDPETGEVAESLLPLNVVEDKHVEGDKESRARAYLGVLDGGRCLLPYGDIPTVISKEKTISLTHDAAEFLDDCAKFPHGKHKEAVDCWSASMKFDMRGIY